MTTTATQDLWFLMIFAEYMPKCKKFFSSRKEALQFLDEFLEKHFPEDLIQKKWPGYIDQVKDSCWHMIHITGKAVPAHRLFRENYLPLEDAPEVFIFRKKELDDGNS